jgi:hypothetical protein
VDIETLLRRNQEQLQLHSDEFDDDELSEQELELVAGGISPFGSTPVGIVKLTKCWPCKLNPPIQGIVGL